MWFIYRRLIAWSQTLLLLVTTTRYILHTDTHLFAGEAAFLLNSLLNPPLADFLESHFGLALSHFGLALSHFILVGCCCVCLACSFGEELDFSTEEGMSVSVGEGLVFGLETGGGDFVKKLKSDLCLAIILRSKSLNLCKGHNQQPPYITMHPFVRRERRSLAGKTHASINQYDLWKVVTWSEKNFRQVFPWRSAQCTVSS